MVRVCLLISLFNFFINNFDYLNYDYDDSIMTLYIDKLSIVNKIYPKENKKNNIDLNVVIMNDSDYPDTNNGVVIIGGHSGTGPTAYFKDLDKLQVGDIVIIDYKENKYFYVVKKMYKDYKDGSINITRDFMKNELTIFTCYPKVKNNYLVVIAELMI